MSALWSKESLIFPEDYGGKGKTIGGRDLLAKGFTSNCPPVVKPSTILIAVVGVSDETYITQDGAKASTAAPDSDGWFISDFYLFHHLLYGACMEQYWLTCLDPIALVEKFECYAHGNPSTTGRKVVLDKDTLNNLHNLRIFKEKDLLERFLTYVADASRRTRGTDTPVLCMIFGHGEWPNSEIDIGGTNLYKHKFREAILRNNPNPNVCVLTTSCYGDGWAVDTSLNTTIMAGASAKNETLSWGSSSSTGRHCGSRYASAVAKALLKQEIEGLDTNDQDMKSPTYAGFVKIIHDTLKDEVDTKIRHELSFAAKDDIWDIHWSQRTGFSLEQFQNNWERLKDIAPSAMTNVSKKGSVRYSDGLEIEASVAERRIMVLARRYMKSHPGPDEAAGNIWIHGQAKRLLQQKPVQNLELLGLMLHHRLVDVIQQANLYRDYLGEHNFPLCEEFDKEIYFRELGENPDKENTYSMISEPIGNSKLFDSPDTIRESGLRPYFKGYFYLVALFIESGRSKDEILTAIQDLKVFKDGPGSRVGRTIRLLKLAQGSGIRDSIKSISQATAKRLRRLSPVKGQRPSLEAQFGDLGIGS